MRAIARAEFLSISQPDSAFAIDADLRIRVAEATLVRLSRTADRLRESGNRFEEFAVLEADDTNRADVIKRVAGVGNQSAKVFSPAWRAFLVGNPKAAGRIVYRGRTSLE